MEANNNYYPTFETLPTVRNGQYIYKKTPVQGISMRNKLAHDYFNTLFNYYCNMNGDTGDDEDINSMLDRAFDIADKFIKKSNK